VIIAPRTHSKELIHLKRKLYKLEDEVEKYKRREKRATITIDSKTISDQKTVVATPKMAHRVKFKDVEDYIGNLVVTPYEAVGLRKPKRTFLEISLGSAVVRTRAGIGKSRTAPKFNQSFTFPIYSRKEMVIVDLYSARNKETTLGKGKLIGRTVVPLSVIVGKDKVASLDGWFPIDYAGNFKTSSYLKEREFRDAIDEDEHKGALLIQKHLRAIKHDRTKMQEKPGRYGSIRLRVEFRRT